MKLVLTSLLLLSVLLSFGQRSLQGKLIDKLTYEPVPFATVYVNGTTNGTYSDEEGFFRLENIPDNALVICSHISYHTQAINIYDDTPSEITIRMEEQKFSLAGIEISEKNYRNDNLNRFKAGFIGNEYWGKNARLLNDNVLYFTREYTYTQLELTPQTKNDIETGILKNIEEWDEDSTFVILKKISLLRALAVAPLEIDMPLLGYRLRVDLVDFTISYDSNSTEIKFLGYYFFQPYEIKNRREARKFETNRQSAYYNSSLHFLSSLYKQKLAENGYKMVELSDIFSFSRNNGNSFNISEHIHYADSSFAYITGLKDKEFIITYFSDAREKPIDLNQSIPELNNSYKTQYSTIYFLSDTCIITQYGTIPNNEIMFMGSISQKRAGSYLPAIFSNNHN